MLRRGSYTSYLNRSVDCRIHVGFSEALNDEEPYLFSASCLPPPTSHFPSSWSHMRENRKRTGISRTTTTTTKSSRSSAMWCVLFFSGFGQSTREPSWAVSLNTVVQAMDEILCAHGRCSTGLVQVLIHLSLTQGDMNEETAHFDAYFCSPPLPASSPISELSHLLSGCVCARRAP